MSVSALALAALAGVARAEITLFASASVPGDAKDKSTLSGESMPGYPNDLFGSWGSAITYLWKNNLYIAVSDRGPQDGKARWQTRMHFITITPPEKAGGELKIELQDTQLLRDLRDKPFWGSSAAIDAGLRAKAIDARRLDPESCREGRDGSLWVADEYGPHIDRFDAKARRYDRIGVPDKFRIQKPNADPEKELPPSNTSGRQPNRGFEGLAINPYGSKLFAIPQSPLIQDGALNDKNERIGKNIRMLQIGVETGDEWGKTAEYVYPLEDAKLGVSEILAVNSRQFLVLERDGKAGAEAKVKRLYLIDIEGASDVSNVAALPSDALPEEIKPARKTLFLDLLDPKFNLAGADMPEKIEGLTWGPEIDGKLSLLVTSDNDLDPKQPTRLWMFTIDKSDLPDYAPQIIDALEKGAEPKVPVGEPVPATTRDPREIRVKRPPVDHPAPSEGPEPAQQPVPPAEKPIEKPTEKPAEKPAEASPSPR
ncbi:MAG: esterase-like activity of phytase family protein [Planctomycetota bacterium]|nr:esterase-like activity of phytase family protein [Planctomycetota bacterium]